MASGRMNVIGAVVFAPPMRGIRDALSLPDADPFYLWVLSSWVLALGAAYFHMGWTGRPNRGVLAVGGWGKGVSAVALTALAVRGRVPALVGVLAVPDLLLALLFAWWLWTSASPR